MSKTREVHDFKRELELIRIYRKNPVLAAEDLLRVDLAVPQQKVLEDMWFKNFTLITAGRGTGKCVSEGTLVFTNRGLERIESLGTDLSVLTDVNIPVHGRYGPDCAKKWYYDGVRPVNRITTELGYSISVTDDHKLLVRSPFGDDHWKYACDIRKGDRVFIQRVSSFYAPLDHCNLDIDYSGACGLQVTDAVLKSGRRGLLYFISRLFSCSSSVHRDSFVLSVNTESESHYIQQILLYLGAQSRRWGSGKEWFVSITKNDFYSLATHEKVEERFLDTVCSVSSGVSKVYDLVVPETHSFCANGFINHNTFLNSVFACLWALLYPGQKVGLLAPSFRQAKMLFAEVERRWNQAPLLQEATTSKPTTASDRCYLHFRQAQFKQGSIIEAIPLGDGCLTADTLVTLEYGFSSFGSLVQVKDYSQDGQVFKETTSVLTAGGFKESDEKYYNGVRDTIRVITESGRIIEGTYDHRLRVVSGGKLEWKRLGDLVVGDSLAVDLSERWHSGSVFNTHRECYAAGLLAGAAVNPLSCCFPSFLLRAEKEKVASFLRGLFDIGGTAFCSGEDLESVDSVGVTVFGSEFARQLQYILTHFSINSSVVQSSENVFYLVVSGENVDKLISKIGVCSLGFKNSSLSFDGSTVRCYAKADPLGTRGIVSDRVSLLSRSKAPTYDLHVPDGHQYIASGFISHNSKIRGARYYAIIADEFAQIPEEIFNTVILPMGATVANPMANVKRLARQKELIRSGKATADDFKTRVENKVIMTSSAFYQFNHMYQTKLEYEEAIRKGETQYATHTISFRDMPEGFLSEENIKNSRARLSSLEFRMEYEAIWETDSAGVFKASLIERCRRDSNHTVSIKGTPGSEYVLGVDPARASDAFALCLIELGQPNKLVAAWEFYQNVFPKMTKTIMDICQSFNVVAIHMDAGAGGGGLAIKDLLAEEERWGASARILDADDEDVKDLSGRHILHLFNPSPKTNAEAVYASLNLLETNNLYLPKRPQPRGSSKEAFDELDSLEGIYENIENMLRQMMLIEVTESRSGVAHFDVPSGGGHASQKKDLFTAFILAGKKTYDLIMSDEEEEGILEVGIIEKRPEVGAVPKGSTLNEMGVAQVPFNSWAIKKTFRPGS